MGNLSGKKKQYAPLTSQKALQKARKQIALQNRARAKRMEYRIAAILRGRRIPMSGAAKQYKGDVEIPFINHPGKYIIECKMTASTRAEIRLQFDWFTKLRFEAKAMSAVFGVLIIHFLKYTNDYVFIHSDDLARIAERYDIGLAALVEKIADLPVCDVRGEQRRGYGFIRDTIERYMLPIDGVKCARFLLPDGEYSIFHLLDFKAMVYNL